MKENIETKDVQRTEYLDKNGLDMLWTKVKENTHNQVEVEYNRAKGAEDDITDKINNLEYMPYVSKTNMNSSELGDFINYQLGATNFTLSANHGSNDARTEFGFGKVSFISRSKDSAVSINCDAVTVGLDNQIRLTNTGISKRNRTIITGSSTEAFSTNGGIIDTTVFALKSDVTEKIAAKADTTALTALEEKVTANTTAIEGKQDAGNYIPYKSIEFQNKYVIEPTYSIELRTDLLNNGRRSYASIKPQVISVKNNSNDYYASVEPEEIQVRQGGNAPGRIRSTLNVDSFGVYSNYDDSVIFKLNQYGIKLEDGDDNHVLTSNASTIDITEYAKKTELPTVPTAVSQLTNDSNFITSADVDLTPYAKKSELPTAATKEKLGVVKVGDGLNIADGTISIDKSSVFIDMMSYGVEWDTTVEDPACTRIGNPLLHKQLPIQSEYKGCLVKNGKVNYYLDPNDWSKKADGTPSVLDGTDGDVMVHIPKFYGKSGSNGNKRWVRIATTKIDPSWVEIPEMFVSAYKVTVNEGSAAPKAASVVNTSSSYRGGDNREGYDQYLSTDKFRTDLGKPRTNVSRATMRTYANNSGQELLCYEFYKWVFYWAYVIEYANFYSQKEFNSNLTSDGYHQGGLGPGVVFQRDFLANYNGYSPITPCGYTNEFGNFSGTKEILIPQFQVGSTTVEGETCYSNRWRGFENPFGDTYTNLDGIVLKRDSAYAESKVYTTTDSSKFNGGSSVMNVAGIEVAANGYIKEFDLGETGEIIPQLIGGSGSTYKCDYHYCSSSSTNNRTLFVGGGNLGGLGFFSSDYTVGKARPDAGFRSVIRA